MKFQNRVTRKEFDDVFGDIPDEDKDLLWAIFNQPTNTSMDIIDYSYECSMCGKPMPYRFCGMCARCEMVWNG